MRPTRRRRALGPLARMLVLALALVVYAAGGELQWQRDDMAAEDAGGGQRAAAATTAAGRGLAADCCDDDHAQSDDGSNQYGGWDACLSIVRSVLCFCIGCGVFYGVCDSGRLTDWIIERTGTVLLLVCPHCVFAAAVMYGAVYDGDNDGKRRDDDDDDDKSGQQLAIGLGFAGVMVLVIVALTWRACWDCCKRPDRHAKHRAFAKRTYECSGCAGSTERVAMLTVLLWHWSVCRYDVWTCEVCYHTNDIVQLECLLCGSSQNGEWPLRINAGQRHCDC